MITRWGQDIERLANGYEYLGRRRGKEAEKRMRARRVALHR